MTQNIHSTLNDSNGNKKTVSANEKKPFDDTLRTIIYAILLAVVFRSFFFEPFHIPSGSMRETLLVGDYIFVSKYSYGYSRYSFPYGLPLFEGRVLSSKPERGDIVVFRPPNNPRMDFIKRIIGLPGDRIQIKNGALFLNGDPVERRHEGEWLFPRPDGSVVQFRRYIETLPNGKTYTTLDLTDSGSKDNTGVYTVPEGHYFMMGDNRDDSEDSRFLNKVGFVPYENIVGRAEVIVFSLDNTAEFWEVWKWPWAFRYDRFFKDIQ
jgi:signal peptidase I